MSKINQKRDELILRHEKGRFYFEPNRRATSDAGKQREEFLPVFAEFLFNIIDNFMTKCGQDESID